MAEIKCPGCGAGMEPFKYPDVTIDECHQCGGTFLDRNELNALATGLAGDIELEAAQHVEAGAALPQRDCPRCTVPMHRVRLLRHSEVVLDHCPDCLGFYLDKGELDAVNKELREKSPNGRSQEFWGPVAGRFVRVDRPTEVTMLEGGDDGFAAASKENVNYLQVSVYFKGPLGLDLWVHRERFSAKLARALRVSQAGRVQVGAADFDEAFVVQGSDPAAVTTIVNDSVRSGLLALGSDPPRVFGADADVEMFDERVVYTEGPLQTLDRFSVKQDPGGVIARLSAIANAVDAARGK